MIHVGKSGIWGEEIKSPKRHWFTFLRPRLVFIFHVLYCSQHPTNPYPPLITPFSCTAFCRKTMGPGSLHLVQHFRGKHLRLLDTGEPGASGCILGWQEAHFAHAAVGEGYNARGPPTSKLFISSSPCPATIPQTCQHNHTYHYVLTRSTLA